MKYLKTFLIVLLAIFTLTTNVFAQSGDEIISNLTYTETYNDIENATSYYDGESLVMTAYDQDENGKDDVWVLYREDLTVERELYDTDGDGEVDIISEFDKEENLISETGEGLKQYEVEPFVEPITELEENDVVEGDDSRSLNENGEMDYAGDLTDIEKLAGEGGSIWTWIIILVVIGGLYMKFKKK